MFLYDYLLACEISTVRTHTLNTYYIGKCKIMGDFMINNNVMRTMATKVET